jgi:hypothetical protein
MTDSFPDFSQPAAQIERSDRVSDRAVAGWRRSAGSGSPRMALVTKIGSSVGTARQARFATLTRSSWRRARSLNVRVGAPNPAGSTTDTHVREPGQRLREKLSLFEKARLLIVSWIETARTPARSLARSALMA